MRRLVIDMDYLAQDPKSGRYRYRRRVPRELVKLIGKREFSISLKTDDLRLALERYATVHHDVESEIATAAALDPADLDHKAAIKTLRKHDLIPPTAKTLKPVTFENDADAFRRFTDAALNAPNHEFDQIVEAKYYGLQSPPLRLSKATEAYLSEHVDADNERDLRKQCGLVVSLVGEVAGTSDPLVEEIDIEVAYQFRDTLRDKGLARGTIQRRINTIRAILNLAKQRFQLTTFVNPFSGLEVPRTSNDRRAKDSRLPLSVDEIRRCNQFIMSKNQDIADLWGLLVFTGARPSEILGLERQDVDLSHLVPHLNIRPNRLRRLKTETSIRKDPLVGPALAIMRRRIELSQINPDGGAPVFPRYASSSGTNTASALMTKAMKQAQVWEKTVKVPYSLRHSHKDWMRRVAPEYWVNLLHGHAQGGIAANYGGDDMLDQLANYTEKACRTSGAWDLWG